MFCERLWRAGPLTLGDRPRIALAVDDGATREEVAEPMRAGVDLIELRVDLFRDASPAGAVAAAARLDAWPLLATIRSAAEGGAWRESDAERVAVFEALAPRIQALDVELSSAAIVPELVRIARANDCLVIGSFHDFGATPDDAALAALAADADAAGVDVLKVAAHCGDYADVRRLAAFTLAHAARGVAVIGMGPAGRMSRALFPALGSLLTYTFLGEPTAPGQLTWRETLAYFNAFYPR